MQHNKNNLVDCFTLSMLNVDIEYLFCVLENQNKPIKIFLVLPVIIAQQQELRGLLNFFFFFSSSRGIISARTEEAGPSSVRYSN